MTTNDPLGDAYAAFDKRECEYREQYPEVDELGTPGMLHVFSLEDKITVLQSRIDAMHVEIEKCRLPQKYAEIHLVRSDYHWMLDNIRDAGVAK